ncbi:MAG: hypothetical protein SPL08_02005 [Pseudomonadota bacterium]|nr:hypothetical protein [Pseudomonadota bacterium]
MVYNTPKEKMEHPLFKTNTHSETWTKMPEESVAPAKKVNQSEQEDVQHKVNICRNQISVNRKLINNCLYDDIRVFLFGVCYIATICACTNSHPKIQKAGIFGAVATMTLNMGAKEILRWQKERLNEQKVFWKRQARHRGM